MVHIRKYADSIITVSQVLQVQTQQGKEMYIYIHNIHLKAKYKQI